MAERFEVSERTIYRDIALLREFGSTIDGTGGLGFVLQSATRPRFADFSADELDALSIGLRFVRRRGNARLSEAAGSAWARIDAGLDWQRQVAIRANGFLVGPSDRSSPIFAIVSTAIDEERKLQIAYRDTIGNSTERTVWPITIGFFDRAEVLAAWCELRGGFRHFLLERIVGTELLPDSIPRPRRLLMAEWQKTQPELDV